MAGNTKRKILKAAVDMFAVHNYHATSMTMIAQKAGVSKGSLYWYFESKESLFRELIIKGIEYFNKKFKKIAYRDNMNAYEKLYEITKLTVKISEENLGMVNILNNNFQFINRKFKQKLKEKRVESIEIYTAIINQGIKEEIIREGNSQHMAGMILAIIFIANINWLVKEIDNPEEQVDFIFEFIMNGIERKEN